MSENKDVLYLKHRPQTLDEFYGNGKMLDGLIACLDRKEGLPHATLFAGGSGMGKTTLAHIVAREIGCDKDFIVELDIGDLRGIETIRDIRQQIHYKPSVGTCRVWILDECHAFTADAQRALLKALENTPKHVYFMLCTTEPQKLLKPIRSRCTLFGVAPLSDKEMAQLITSILKKEQVVVPQAAVDAIILNARGSSRTALVMLDKMISLPVDKMAGAADMIEAEADLIIQLCRALMNTAPWKNIVALLDKIEELQQEPEEVRRAVLGYCAGALKKSGWPKAYAVGACFRQDFYNTGRPGLVLACWDAVQNILLRK